MKNKVWRIAENIIRAGITFICWVFDMSAAAVLS